MSQDSSTQNYGRLHAALDADNPFMSQGNTTQKYLKNTETSTVATTENCIVPPCMAFFSNSPNLLIKEKEYKVGNYVQRGLPPYTADEDPWAVWFAQAHGCEMGDAFEPSVEDMLSRAGFDITPMTPVPTEQVIRAAEMLRNQGDRRSSLAMMTTATAERFEWWIDPNTNSWSYHVRF